MVVASTAIGKRSAVAGVDVRHVRCNAQALDSAKLQLDGVIMQRSGKAPEVIHVWFVDVCNNSLTVDVAPGAMMKAIDFVALSGADTGTLRFRTVGSAPCPLATLQDGSEYLSTTSTGT